MKTAIFVLALLIVSILACSAFAEYKEYYATDNNKYTIDPESVVADNVYRYAWVKWEFGKPEEFDGTAMMLIKMKADCNSKTLKSIEAIAHNKNNVLIGEEKHDNPLVLNPDTANLATYEKICESQVTATIKPAKRKK